MKAIIYLGEVYANLHGCDRQMEFSYESGLCQIQGS